MTRIIASLAEIGSRYEALFCDLWGCVHNGERPFPAAVAALQAYRRQGGRVVLLTNAPRPKPSVVRQLDRIGVPRDAWDEVVTSGDAAQYALVNGVVGERVYFIGAPQHMSFFNEMAEDITGGDRIRIVPLDEAEGVVCTGPVDDLNDTPEDYRATLLMAKTRGLKLLCANPDIVVDWGDKRLYCAGALAELYTEMGGESLYFGKPWPPIYDLARRRLAALGCTPGEAGILAIGDGIGTDIKGGLAEGFDTLFVTGGLSADAFGHDPDHPDPALLDVWLDARQISATWAIGKLR